MATTKIVNGRTGSSVNNGRLQPLTGLDTIVYIQDQQSGNVIEFGEFTGFQYTIRNATEPYMPLGSKTITYLDGEYQIGFVLEQGKINLDALPQLLGYNVISPIIRIGRSPRFQIVVEYNAKELANKGITTGGNNTNELGLAIQQGTATSDGSTRVAQGRYIFTQCKIDAFTSGAMAGRQAIADRIEGLAEGFQFVNNAVGLFDIQTNTVLGSVTPTTSSGTNIVPAYNTGTARLWGANPTASGFE